MLLPISTAVLPGRKKKGVARPPQPWEDDGSVHPSASGPLSLVSTSGKLTSIY